MSRFVALSSEDDTPEGSASKGLDHDRKVPNRFWRSATATIAVETLIIIMRADGLTVENGALLTAKTLVSRPLNADTCVKRVETNDQLGTTDESA